MGQVKTAVRPACKSANPNCYPAELVALLDSLGSGTLNEQQIEALQFKKAGLLSSLVRLF